MVIAQAAGELELRMDVDADIVAVSTSYYVPLPFIDEYSNS
jgi:hypothetical protein